MAEEVNESPSIFYFESEQLAFKGNDDYKTVLSSLAKLEAIRNKSLNDLDKLYELKEKAIKNPLDFVKTLQQDPKSLNIPSRPCIPDVPDIDWTKYSFSTAEEVGRTVREGTRGKRVHVPDMLMQRKSMNTKELQQENVTIIRGRVKSEQKPETFNQLWTTDEQRKLEELLIKYPTERIEARRYRKIADELGTKTLQQVASRIQKYFIRLAQSGLPVPGKIPSLASIKRKPKHKHQMKNKCALPSTFLQAYVPPIFMSEQDEADSLSSLQDSESDDSDSDLDLPDDLKDTDEYKELMSLKSLRQAKCSGKEVVHEGYKCDGCGEEPIHGTRYHCIDCVPHNSVDFCSLCNRRRITIGGHRPSHGMTAIEKAEGESQSKNATSLATSNDVTHDKDYLTSKFNIPGHYNYLDPNYMPSRNKHA